MLYMRETNSSATFVEFSTFAVNLHYQNQSNFFFLFPPSPFFVSFVRQENALSFFELLRHIMINE